MFHLPRSIRGWSYTARVALTVLALLAVMPSVLIATLGLAFTLLPAAVLIVPFVMVVTLRKQARARLGPPPTTLGNHVLTHTGYATAA